jgi:hypothetical protein
MDLLEETAGQDLKLMPEDIAMWARINTSLAALMPGCEETEDERFRELSAETMGVQISMYPGELSLSVAYWYEGDEAVTVVAQLRQIVAAIEEVTGLVAYDPQSTAPFLDGGAMAAVATFDQAAAAQRKYLAGDGPSPV